MLKVYAYPPSSWSFVRGGPLPVAAINEHRRVTISERAGTTLRLWAPWLRADIAMADEAKRSAVRPAGLQPRSSAGPKRRRTRSQPS